VTLHSPAAGLAAPVTVAEIELADPVSVHHVSVAGADHDRTRPALVLVRLHTRPMTTIVVDAPGGVVDAGRCAAAAWAALGPAPGSRTGAPPPQPLTAAEAPPVTVVVATRERPGSLAACLDSLARLDYPDYEVVVVDNDPVSDDTATLIRHRAEPSIRYARESRRGLAAAHNCGLALAEGTIVAFTDDDVIVDRHWLTEVARGFAADTEVGCVTGLIMSAELQTPAQVLLDAHFGLGKGFQQRVFDLAACRPADPLFPFTAGRLGSGANMSFHADLLRRLGGFDPAIGAGTVARGGDDLAAFFAVIVSGLRLVYQPGALVWHRGRPDLASLPGQAYGYGVGLGAYLASALTHHPASIGPALRRAPAGLAHALRTTSSHAARPGDAWPRQLTRLQRRGLAFGPFAYALSHWRTRGTGRPHADRELLRR
jgi:GT2 family glycosyltransferase